MSIIDEDGSILAGDPRLHENIEQVPLVAYGKRLGALRYQARTPLRTSDVRLLDDLAAHVAGLLHARQLAHDLQRTREHLVMSREDERLRLRRDLHDGLGPALAGHVLRLDLAARQVPPGSTAHQNLEALRDEMQATVADVRRVVEGLRPPALDEVGFTAAVTQAALRLTLPTATRCDVEVGELPPLSAAAEVAAYRIINEAVINVVRHACATRCRVQVLAVESLLEIRVCDDGRGVNGSASAGHGLETMRERAEELGGRLTVTADATMGTTVFAVIPLGQTTQPTRSAPRATRTHVSGDAP